MTDLETLAAAMADDWNLHHVGRSPDGRWFAQLVRGGEHSADRVVEKGATPAEAIAATLRAWAAKQALADLLA